MQIPENVSPKVWKKMIKVLGDTKVEEMEALAEDDLRAAIASGERNIAEQERLRDEDENLQAAKENAKLLGSAYRDSIAYQRAQQRLAAHLLQSKGKL